MPKLLVVDDEPLICQSFSWVFATDEVEVITSGTLAEGWRRIEEDRPDVVVLDFKLPDGSGLDFFDRIRAANLKLPVIFLTAHGTTDTAIEAMKRGAFDYLAKPFELDQMTELLERAFEAARLMREPTALPDDPQPDRIIGRSPLLRDICKQIGRVASLDVNVLILGESGTGKELVARALYQHGKRAEKPFLAINCAAIPEGLVESELFGHESGAFTGAMKQRIGRFEQADGGTIFLDEIGDMPLAAQAKILRFLQDRSFERVGGTRAISTRVRVLAATNHDLEQLIADGRFRSDLYYRLKEIIIRVPPLRERSEDIMELSHYFLYQFVREAALDICGFAPEVLEIFRRYPWPGNVRELRSVIREAAVRTTGMTILPAFLPPGLLEPGQQPEKVQPAAVGHAGGHLDIAGLITTMLNAGGKELYHRVIGEVERELIAQVLRHCHGHLGKACDRLGIDRKTLRTRLRGLAIIPDKGASDSREPAED
jgi:two-component system nitrogen regulation response regulator GlnG